MLHDSSTTGHAIATEESSFRCSMVLNSDHLCLTINDKEFKGMFVLATVSAVDENRACSGQNEFCVQVLIAERLTTGILCGNAIRPCVDMAINM